MRFKFIKKLPNLLKLPKQILLTFSWFSLSIFTLLSAVFLLLSLQASGSNLINLPANAYQLFASLPKNGEVLGASIVGKDGRVETLQSFLERYNSPLAPFSSSLVSTADRYQLPWTLLVAIAGKESGFGKVIPYGSYNAWGWGILTGQSRGVDFTSWEEAIERVAKGIKRDYFDKGLTTPESMEYKYTPPSAASHHSWRDGVNFFMNQLENWQ